MSTHFASSHFASGHYKPSHYGRDINTISPYDGGYDNSPALRKKRIEQIEEEEMLEVIKIFMREIL